MNTPPSPPRLRTDIVVSRQETPEGRFVVLKDPLRGLFFRLREVEWAIARRLDGATSLEAVAAQVGPEHDVEVAPADLAGFVAQLGRSGLLDTGEPAPPRARPLFRGSILWLRLKAFDPDPLLERLLPHVRFCFTPYFVVGAALLILWAVVTTFGYRAEIAEDVARLWRVESLLLVWLTMIGVTTLHEFAHGLTCKHFGGKVHEMGFLLIYFQPAFYCNISDAWLFPEKHKRLWVTAAGAYFELFLWALATLVWRVGERDTWVSALALVIMATSGVKLFFNLNPLIKLDGYYLLCDLLDVPNLRPRAFGYLAGRLKRLLGGVARETMEPSRRERRIFVAYGLLAGAFSYWLLSAILLAFGNYLTWKYQGWGFAMFAGLFAATFGRPLKSLLPRVRRPRRAIVVALAGIGAVALAVTRLGLTVSGEFELRPADNADVRAEVEGVIEEIYVDEGTWVSAGQPIARVSDRELRARHAMVEAEIGEHEARLRQLRAGPRREELEIARVALQKADDRLRYARTELDRIRTLVEMQVASQAELERAQQQETILIREAEEARARLAGLEAGTRPEEIAAVEQQIARAQAERSRLEDELARVVATAPHGGVVTTPHLREKVGEFVEPGDLIGEVHAVDTVTAVVAVSERDIGDVRVGQPATLRVRAYPDRTFNGTVAAVAPAAEDVGSRGGRVVKVSIDIANRDGLLKPHLTGYARIHAGERRAVDLLTRRVRRFLRLEFWSWW